MATTAIDDLREELGWILELPGVEAVLLFGSRASGTSDASSDIDICVVAPQITDRRGQSELLGRLWQRLDPRRYDVWLFEELPLYMKMSVITSHVVIACRDVPALFEYFYRFRKIWKDQAHRQAVKF